jgi:hypothetical protein
VRAQRAREENRTDREVLAGGTLGDLTELHRVIYGVVHGVILA